MEEDKVREDRSFAETPNWAVATVITVMVILGFFVHICLKHFGKVTMKALCLKRIDEVIKALGAKESIVFEYCSDVVGEILQTDVMKSVKYMVEFLVENTKVLLYQGHFDLTDGAVVSTEAWVKTIKWEGIDKFLMAERKVWKVKDELAGYVQKWGNLSHVVVMGAGHLVPTDQPLNSQVMIEDWVLDKGLFANEQEKL